MNAYIPDEIILASASPRRAELLRSAGIGFKMQVTDINESWPDDLAFEEVPEYLAVLKAKSVQEGLSNETVIAADTIVLLEGEILGKPEGKAAAANMLRKLSGKAHDVITGVCILDKDHFVSFSETTKVFFKDLSEDDIEFYLEQFKPYDKAGGYAIQEWIGKERLLKYEGDYDNVVGLPVGKVLVALKNF